MKQILSIVLFTILAFNLSAQKFYLGFQTGYGLVTSAGQVNLSNYENDLDNNYIYMIEKGGYGEGLNIALKTGYRFNEVLHFELATNYLIGTTYSISIIDRFQGSEDYTESKYDYTARSLQFIPTIAFNFPMESKFTPYLKFGLNLSSNTLKMLRTDTYNSTNTSSEESKIERFYEGNIAIGYNATLGTNYKISDKISIFSEFNFLQTSFAPKQMELTEYSYNGESRLSDLSTSQKEFIFLDEYTSNSFNNENEPTKTSKILFPLSNLSLNLGILINL